MKEYESIIILKPDLELEEKNIIVEKVTNLMKSFAKINETKIELHDLGKRNLAYQIRNYMQGEYIQHYFYASMDDAIKLESEYKKIPEIIKFIVLKGNSSILIIVCSIFVNTLIMMLLNVDILTRIPIIIPKNMYMRISPLLKYHMLYKIKSPVKIQNKTSSI